MHEVSGRPRVLAHAKCGPAPDRCNAAGASEREPQKHTWEKHCIIPLPLSHSPTQPVKILGDQVAEEVGPLSSTGGCSDFVFTMPQQVATVYEGLFPAANSCQLPSLLL